MQGLRDNGADLSRRKSRVLRRTRSDGLWAFLSATISVALLVLFIPARRRRRWRRTLSLSSPYAPPSLPPSLSSSPSASSATVCAHQILSHRPSPSPTTASNSSPNSRTAFLVLRHGISRTTFLHPVSSAQIQRERAASRSSRKQAPRSLLRIPWITLICPYPTLPFFPGRARHRRTPPVRPVTQGPLSRATVVVPVSLRLLPRRLSSLYPDPMRAHLQPLHVVRVQFLLPRHTVLFTRKLAGTHCVLAYRMVRIAKYRSSFQRPCLQTHIINSKQTTHHRFLSVGLMMALTARASSIDGCRLATLVSLLCILSSICS